MPLMRLKISNVGPFSDIEFRFDRHVNVFVGPNNSGKSTILTALGDLCAYPFSFPEKLLHKKPAKFTLHYQAAKDTIKKKSGQLPVRLTRGGNLSQYWTPERWQNWMRVIDEFEYAVFVPALRQSSDYRSKGPVSKDTQQSTESTRELEALFLQEKYGRARYANIVAAGASKNLTARVKASFGVSAYVSNDEKFIQRMVELDYRAYREKTPEIRQVIDKIASISSEITEGFPMKFIGIAEDKNGLYPQFETPSGIVPLDVLSQGTHSIIHTIASIILEFAEYHKFSSKFEKKPGILIIDEIDAHLHPSWQRRFIPALRKHLPNFQIFCSTHSPFLLGGLEAGQIQLLQRDSDGQITVSTNQYDIKGWSFDEVLRYVLEVAAPTDLETQGRLDRLQYLQNLKRPSTKQRKEMDMLRKQIHEQLVSGPVESEIRKIRNIISDDKVESKNQSGSKRRTAKTR